MVLQFLSLNILYPNFLAHGKFASEQNSVYTLIKYLGRMDSFRSSVYIVTNLIWATSSSWEFR